MKTLTLVCLLPNLVLANVTYVGNTSEEAMINLLISLIVYNMKNNGWNTILTYGQLPDYYYKNIKTLPFTFVTSNSEADDFYIEDAVPYHLNTAIVASSNFTEFEVSLRQVMDLPYWHPLANIVIFFNEKVKKQEIATILYILWYYRASNGVLVQYDDTEKLMYVSQYNPFVVDDSWDLFGCRTVRPMGMPIGKFKDSFLCEENCHNVSLHSKHRRLRFGTCVGIQTHAIPYNDIHALTKLTLFEERGKNFHGFALRTFTPNTPPFMTIKQLENGTYEFSSRDGIIWNNLIKLMNFTMDLTPSADALKKKFNYEISIQQIFTVAHRKGDLYPGTIYQFDVILVELDYSFAYKDSGVCFMSHKAPYETVLFDLKTLQHNIETVMEFLASMFCIWLVFMLYSALETEKITLDLIGKNFLNTIRSILSITLYKPPKRQSFRIFLSIILWSFFIINFSTQAAITSFFTAFKRGKEVETFADIVETGYKIQGMASPDVVLPDDNELFRKINSKLEPINDMFGCVNAMSNDSRRLCLVDCSLGEYLKINLLNAKGEQYLHIAKDRVHNYYLNFIFPKHSIMTDTVNKYLMVFYEAGLIRKWEEYRFNHIKEESPVKPLGMDDIKGIFHVYFGVVLVTFIMFLMEVFIGNYKRMKLYLILKVKRWRRTRLARKAVKLERKQNKIQNVCSSTQT